MLKYRRGVVLAGHMLLGACALVGAFLLRFEGAIPLGDLMMMWATLPVSALLKGAAVSYFKIPQELPRHVGMGDIVRVLKACTVSSACFIIVVVVMYGHGFPRSVFILDYILTVGLYAGMMFFSRIFKEMTRPAVGEMPGRRTLIMGAGTTGELALRSLNDGAAGLYAVVGFLDDSPMKQGMSIRGYQILGPIADAPHVIRDMDVTDVIIALPSATKVKTREIVKMCASRNVSFRIIPTLKDYMTGEVEIQRIRELSLADLLGREPIELDKSVVSGDLEGKRVLVTGAGGSIGSELVRQIARYKPASVVLVDAAETPLFHISNELGLIAPDIDRFTVLADVKHGDLVEKTFAQFKPERIYHAAAYKHVPMMESHPVEAVFNNILATRNLALSAVRHGVERFVMISTDKAVQAESVMGATKRCAELLVLHLNGRGTKFVTVRFGNVLGSAGSVVPIFKQQIAEGGPVKVTHPAVARYFITIPEAVELVLQAGAAGQGGEVFILDMGDPIKIADLARNMIEMSGLELGADIQIQFTGLRPGEKLHEKLVAAGEDIESTHIPKVMVHRSYTISGDGEGFLSDLKGLEEAAMAGDDARTVSELWDLLKCRDTDNHYDSIRSTDTPPA